MSGRRALFGKRYRIEGGLNCLGLFFWRLYEGSDIHKVYDKEYIKSCRPYTAQY
ncbi:hypothetical protein J2Z83_002611 [Virgibacillus natechei]|uniref:Uncharacterized protein n=1 Tax=Virgibacillus natechei TaxID=1216297 RepID=A0ABS4IIT1_9BACI|nr:hypothetical protein [Virgibacillus natechei]